MRKTPSPLVKSTCRSVEVVLTVLCISLSNPWLLSLFTLYISFVFGNGPKCRVIDLPVYEHRVGRWPSWSSRQTTQGIKEESQILWPGIVHELFNGQLISKCGSPWFRLRLLPFHVTGRVLNGTVTPSVPMSTWVRGGTIRFREKSEPDPKRTNWTSERVVNSSQRYKGVFKFNKQ